LAVGGLLLPAGLTRGGFADFDEQVFNQLGSLHLVELLHADTEELDGQIFGFLLVHFVVTDDAQNKTALTIRAVPRITISWGLLVTIGLMASITVELVGADRSSDGRDRFRCRYWLKE
jgi:hypothetical protein